MIGIRFGFKYDKYFQVFCWIIDIIDVNKNTINRNLVDDIWLYIIKSLVNINVRHWKNITIMNTMNNFKTFPDVIFPRRFWSNFSMLRVIESLLVNMVWTVTLTEEGKNLWSHHSGIHQDLARAQAFHVTFYVFIALITYLYQLESAVLNDMFHVD